MGAANFKRWQNVPLKQLVEDLTHIEVQQIKKLLMVLTNNMDIEDNIVQRCGCGNCSRILGR